MMLQIKDLITKGKVLFKKRDRRIHDLKDKYKYRRLFVLGNGPSLTISDLKKLKNEITIGSNGLFLAFNEMGFLPNFFTVEDRLVAEDRADTINNIKGTHKIFPSDLSQVLKQDSYTLYVNFIRQYKGFPKFSKNFYDAVFWGGTVTMFNLQLAYYLGSREIYLLGVDHSYLNPQKGDQVSGNIIKSNNPDKNHFHPQYFGPGFRYHDPKVDRMEAAYEEAKRFIERSGGKIYNATRGGQLEVFPRVDFDSLFGE